jgi:hypothetical protein
MADRASTKQKARQITIIFFIADILLFIHAADWAADYDGYFLAAVLTIDKIVPWGNPGHGNRSGITSPPERDTSRLYHREMGGIVSRECSVGTVYFFAVRFA